MLRTRGITEGESIQKQDTKETDSGPHSDIYWVYKLQASHMHVL